MTNDEVIVLLEITKAEIEWEYPLDYQIALDIAISALKTSAYDKLKTQIKDLKRKVTSQNTDYLTGYISALSVVEGMIAENEEEKDE